MCEIEPKPLGALCKKISTKKSVQKNRHFFWLWANGQLSRNLQDYLFIGEDVISSICTTKHNLNFDTFYLKNYPC
jgi:hypothetical protein